MSSARAGRALQHLGVFFVALGVLPACGGAAPSDSERASTAAARRVVSLVPAATALLVAMGAGDRLIGRALDDPTPEALHLPTVGTVLAPSLERLALLDPDLILVPPGTYRDIPAGLARVAVVDLRRLADLRRVVSELGAWTGSDSAAARLGETLTAGLDEVASAVAGRARPSVVWMVSGRPLVAAGPGTFLDDLVTVAGGVNVLSDSPSPWPSPSPEVLAERRPDVWLWSAPGAPGLDGLRRAVPGARLHRLDPDLFHQPGPGVVEAAGRLAHLLHAGPPSPDLPLSTRYRP